MLGFCWKDRSRNWEKLGERWQNLDHLIIWSRKMHYLSLSEIKIPFLTALWKWNINVLELGLNGSYMLADHWYLKSLISQCLIFLMGRNAGVVKKVIPEKKWLPLFENNRSVSLFSAVHEKSDPPEKSDPHSMSTVNCKLQWKE